MKYKQLLSGTTAALIFGLSTQAQESGTETLSPLNVQGIKDGVPVLSTGLKTTLTPSEIPQSNSIITSNQIRAQGLKSIGDIIDYTPGVNNSQGEGHRDAAVFRGMRTTQDFYRDGVRDDVQYYRPLYNIESVEVLRGPNAVVSGFGSAYGLINRVSKKGILGEDFTVFSGSVDSFGESVVQFDKNMQLNESSALRVNVFGENLENHRDFYYGDGFGINPTLMYSLGDGSSLSLSYEYLDQERFIDRGIPTGGTDSAPVEALKDYVFGDSTENFSTHEAHIFRAIFEHELTDIFSGRLSASLSNHDKLYQNHYAKSYSAGATIADSNVTFEGYKDTTQRNTGIFSYEVSGMIESGNIVHSIIAGIEYTTTDNDNDRFYADWSSKRGIDTNFSSKAYSKETFRITRNMVTGNVGRESVDQNITTNNYTMSPYDDTHGELSVFSIYLQDEINFSDSLDLVLGVRFDKMEYDVENILGTNPPSDSDDTISPKAGVIYSVSDELSLYASYSETFQQIKGDQYASLNSTDSLSDPNTFENLEAGLRYDFANGLSFSASVYELQANKPTTNDNGATFVNTQSENTGFELQLQGSITDKWFISAGYTSLDATNEVGLDLRESPESSLSIFNNFLVTDRLAVNLGVVYYDESLINNPKYDDHDDDPLTPDTWATYSNYLPDYTRIDLGASYLLTENTTLQLNIENLSDELYFPHAHGSHQASVGAPVNATFAVTSSF